MTVRQYTIRDQKIEEGISIEILSAVMHAWNSDALDLLVPIGRVKEQVSLFIFMPSAFAYEWDDSYVSSNKLLPQKTITLIKRLFVETQVLVMPVPSRVRVFSTTTHPIVLA